MQGLVLLSGGLDSVAALYWAKQRYTEVVALHVQYGQPHKDQERIAAALAAQEAEVPLVTVALADGLLVRTGLLAGVADHDDALRGTSPAYVPQRNLVLLSVAAAHAAARWPTAWFELVIGAVAEDADAFPDCRPAFFYQATQALTMGRGSAVTVHAPWVAKSKADVLRWCVDNNCEEPVTRSFSCYRGTICGTCTACVLRSRAFAETGLEDRAAVGAQHGGDVTRDQRLRGE